MQIGICRNRFPTLALLENRTRSKVSLLLTACTDCVPCTFFLSASHLLTMHNCRAVGFHVEIYKISIHTGKLREEHQLHYPRISDNTAGYYS